jgi:hypothetical protein
MPEAPGSPLKAIVTAIVENAGIPIPAADEYAVVVARARSDEASGARPEDDRRKARKTLRYLEARETERLARSRWGF